MATPEEEKAIREAINQLAREQSQIENDRLNLSMSLVETLKETLGITNQRSEFDKNLLSTNRSITKSLITQKEGLREINDIEKQITKNGETRDKALKLQESLTNSIGEGLSQEFKQSESILAKRLQIDKALQKEIEKLNSGEAINQSKIDRLKEMAQVADEQLANSVRGLSVSEQQLLVTKQNVAALESANAERQHELDLAKQIQSAEGLTGKAVGTIGKLLGLNSDTQNKIKQDAKTRLQTLQDEGKLMNGYQGKLQGLSAYAKSFGTNFKKAVTDPAAILSLIGTTLLKNSQLTNQFQQELGVSYTNSLAMRNELNNAAGASNDLFINSEKLQKSFFALAENTGVFFDLSSKSAETFTNLTERIGLAGAEAGNLTMLLRLQGKDTETTMSNLVGTASAALATSKSTASVKQILGDVASSSKGLQASFAANPGALAKAAVAARELGASLKDIEGVQKSLLDFEGSISAELEAELLTGKQLNLEKARTAALNNDLEGVSRELSKQGVDLASFSGMNVIQQEKMAAAMGLSRDAMGDMLLKQQTQNMTADEVRKKFGDQTYEQFKALSAQDKFNAATAKLKDLFGSVMTALTPIIDGVAMLLEPIAFVAKLLGKLNELTGGFSNALIGVAIAAKALGANFGDMGSMIRAAFKKDTYTGFFSGIQDKFKGLSSPLKTLGDKLKGVFGGAADASKGIQFDPRMAGGGRFRDMASGRMVSEEAANAAGVFKPGTGPAATAASGATDAASATGATPAPADDGKALKKKMQNIAEGIKSFASTEVVKGALSMIVAAPGLVALGLASLPLKITEKINGKAIETGMTGIANGIKAFGNTTKGALALLIATPGLLALGLAAPGLALIGVVGTGIAAGLKGISVGMGSLGKNMANVIKGSIALSTLALPIAAASAAFSLLKGVDPGSMIAFSISLGILGAAAAILGNMLPQVALGALALTTLALPIAAASLAFSLLKGIDPSSMIAFSVSLGILGAAAAILGSMLPMVAMGALALTTLALPIVAVSAAFSLLKGIDTSMIMGFATTLGILGLAAAGFGMVAPLITTGSVAIGALGLALLPLAVAMNIAAPAAEQFAQVLSSLGEINVANLLGIAIALPALAIGIGALALSIGTAVLAAVTLKVLTKSLEPLAKMAPKFDLTNKSLAGIAGSIALISTSLAGLDVSKLSELTALGPIALAALTLGGIATPNAVGGGAIATAGNAAGAGITSVENTSTTNVEGISAASPNPGEDMRAMIEETVASTINALVPEMVASLKEGQGNVKVTNDNFNASSQGQLPDQIRNISNNNFA